MPSQLVRSAKNMVKGYSSTQVLVRDATSNDSNSPDVGVLEDLADKTYDTVEFFEIMDMLDKRLNDKGKYWRHVAKSLTVLDYLVRFGSENCVLWCKENLYIIKTLREFRHENENTGNDEGQIIRVKAKELTSLLTDDERLREERALNRANRRGGDNQRRRRRTDSRSRSRPHRGDPYDSDLQRALEESKLTAEEEEARRKEMAQYENQDPDLLAALQLSKEEEELKRLQDMQRLQELQAHQNVYYDVFGIPISQEEYYQYQEQQAAQLAQQQEAVLLAQQQEAARLAQQQQAALLAQQQQQQMYYNQMQQIPQQQPLATGNNNPFSRDNVNANNNNNNNNLLQDFDNNPVPAKPVTTAQVTQQPQQPLRQTRTGNQSISDKFSELNTLLATGTGIDTFGNTGESRIPAQHTKTGTFINSQGTGYKQVTNEPKNNPFLSSQYTGLPSTNIVPSHTGYGFGNQGQNSQQQTQQPQQQTQQPQQQYSQNQQYQQQPQPPQQQYQQYQPQQQQYQQYQPQQQFATPDQGVSLIDL